VRPWSAKLDSTADESREQPEDVDGSDDTSSVAMPRRRSKKEDRERSEPLETRTVATPTGRLAAEAAPDSDGASQPMSSRAVRVEPDDSDDSDELDPTDEQTAADRSSANGSRTSGSDEERRAGDDSDGRPANVSTNQR
jgi:hypothetical protein